MSCYTLFPLLFEAQEYPIKVLLLLLHSILMWFGFSEYFSHKGGVEGKSASGNGEGGGFSIGMIGKSYLFGLLVVEIWGQYLHRRLLGDRLSFVPLMLIFIYGALGITYSFVVLAA